MRRPREDDDILESQDVLGDFSHRAACLLAESLREGDDEPIGADKPLEALGHGREILARRGEDDDIRSVHRLLAVRDELDPLRDFHAFQKARILPRFGHFLDIVGERAPHGDVMPVTVQKQGVRHAPSAISYDRYFHCGDIISYLNVAHMLDRVHQKRHLVLHYIISYLNVARQLDFVHQKRHLELHDTIS